MKKTGLGVLISTLLMFVLVSCGKQSQNTLVKVTETKENCYETIYDGIKHDFQLDLPATVENAPLVVMLPGYGESAGGFRQKVSFEKEANERGFAVVYVTGAPSPEDKTSANGWNSGIGESSKKDVEFLCGLSHYLCKTYKLDEYVLVDCVYTEDWDMDKRRSVAKTIRGDNYITYLALKEDKVVGFIGLLKKLEGPYMILDMMQVSAECRGLGVGRQLFNKGKEEARKAGAKALYISACSSEETIAFYKAMGSRLAECKIKETVQLYCKMDI